jgi:uncharacterized protein YegP (UPF0339 family)
VPGRFVIRTGRTGKFRFVLVSPKGKPIATSELYESKAACRNGIRAVQRLAAEASVDDESKAPSAGLKSAAAPVKTAAAKAKAVVARAAKKVPAPAPVKEAAEKAKAVVGRAATKASPIAVKAKEAMEGTLQKAKQVAAERKTGPAEKAEVGKPPEKPTGEQRS